jgi:hypothetical protein
MSKTEEYTIKSFLLGGYLSAMVGSLFSQKYLWSEAYYHLMEIGFISYLLSFYLLSRKASKKFTTLWQTITLIILLSSISTLIDEFFYDAKIVELNDFIRFVIIVLISFKIKYKWKISLKR